MLRYILSFLVLQLGPSFYTECDEQILQADADLGKQILPIDADLEEQIFSDNERTFQELHVFRRHVPARYVPAPSVDSELRKKFLQLFKLPPGDTNRNGAKGHKPASLVNRSTINEINELSPRNAFFYSFAPRHVRAKQMLENVFLAQETVNDVYNVAKNILERGEVNKKVWFYALLGTFLSRPDLNVYLLGWSLDVTPDLYLTNSVLNSALSLGSAGGNNNCVVYKGTRGTTWAENKLWYFREDVMINHIHWYWHQYFPLQSRRHPDRRGETFYFIHHNIIARYNAERLSNRLGMVTSLDLRVGGNIGVGYNADIIDKQSEKFWTPRQANVLLQNITHINDPDIEMNIYPGKLAKLLQTFIQHIRQGFLLTKNNATLDIRNFDGIDILGNTLEAIGNLSVHPDFYHSHGLHNLGHLLIALSADPDFNKRLPAGVMGDSPLSLRDPSFYKIHSLVDDIFDIHKRTLKPYQLERGEFPLIWRGVKIRNLKVESAAEKKANVLKTLWSKHKFPLEQGIDGSIHDGNVSVDICHRQLNHRAFTFQLTVNVNNQMKSSSGRGTVRIFMAPRYNLNGKRFRMGQTRKLMFQLDSFPVELRRGRNIITRRSRDSSSTKPWSRSLQQMLNDPGNGGKAEYCGCGWPDHLYIPKGTEQGMTFDLFAMITSFDLDRVQDTAEDLSIQEPCNSPHLFCGIPYRKYPDRRPMGYPFDRLPYSLRNRPVESLEEYVSHVPNMGSTTAEGIMICTFVHRSLFNIRII